MMTARALKRVLPLLVLAACGSEANDAPSSPCDTNLRAEPPAGLISFSQILPATIPAPAGWTVQDVEGDAPLLAVLEGDSFVGLVQLGQYEIDEATLPRDRERAGLRRWAESYYAGIAADRELTYQDYEQTDDMPADASFGQLCAIRYGFRGEHAEGTSDRVVGYATFDRTYLYFVMAWYNDADAVESYGFLNPDDVDTFAPSLGELASALAMPVE